jgi:hypothetical protein
MTEPTSRDTRPTTTTYRAQTDATIKTWHLGAAERGAACCCGVRLLTPDDTRAFALKVPAERRQYETSDDLARVTCGSCKRTREWSRASGAERTEATATASTRRASTRTASSRRASTRTATPADAGAGMNEYTAAQLLVDGVEARARRRADRTAAETDDAGPVSGGTVIEADPETGLPRIKPEYAAKADAIAAAQKARSAGKAGR